MHNKWQRNDITRIHKPTCSDDVVQVWVHLQFSIASMVMLFSVFVVLRSLRFILILHQEPWYLWVPWVWIDQEYSRTGKLVNCVCEGEVNETTRKCVAWQTSPTCFSTKKKCQIQTSWSLWGDEMRFQSKSWMGHGSNISEKKVSPSVGAALWASNWNWSSKESNETASGTEVFNNVPHIVDLWLQLVWYCITCVLHSRLKTLVPSMISSWFRNSGCM